MHFIHPTTLIIVLLCTICTIQGKPTNSSSNNLKDYVKYLLNIIGVENEYVRFLSFMKVYRPEDAKMKGLYDELFSLDAYISDLTTVYSKYYTLDDVIKLIDFYSSPLGKKTLQINQQLNPQMEDIMLSKISDYIFTSTQYGFDIPLPQIRQ
jgi:hypothetical protein